VPRRIAVTGAAGFLGRQLIARLEQDERVEHILAVDVRAPTTGRDKTTFRETNLTRPACDLELAPLLEAEGIDTLVHLAWLSLPAHDSERAHELEAIGTMHVLNACAGTASVRRVVMQSSTMVYGAHRDHPNFITEDTPLTQHHRSRWVVDRVDAERQAARFASRTDEKSVCVLRFAPIMGPTAIDYVARYLDRPVVPTVLGYDPLMQFVHEEDAVGALHTALHANASGAFNIGADGVLPLSTVLKLTGRIGVPIPAPFAIPGAHAMWLLKASSVPGLFFNYLRYGWVADTHAARDALDFYPRYTTRDIVLRGLR
jgi:UDP-glucose 4-epimerase